MTKREKVKLLTFLKEASTHLKNNELDEALYMIDEAFDAIDGMQTDTEEIDDWSTSMEARVDRLEQRLTWMEMASGFGVFGRRGGDIS